MRHIGIVLVVLAMVWALPGCGGGGDGSGSSSDADTADTGGDTTDTVGDTTGTDATDGTDGTDGEAIPPIGSPLGDPVSIDHAKAYSTVEQNLIKHIDGLEKTLKFLENSGALNNLIDLLSCGGDDDDAVGEEGEEGEEGECGLDIDLSDFRDGLVEFVHDKIMVEATATVAKDGLSISYQISPEYFCAEEVEGDETEEAKAEREKDESECADRLTKNPLRIDVMSDGEGRMNLSLKAGNDQLEAFALQIHNDRISLMSELPNIRSLFEVFIDPEDFELPGTMNGEFEFEIRQDDSIKYTVRFAMPEAINLVPDAQQEQYALHVNESAEAGRITIDGEGGTITGVLGAAEVMLSLPYQTVVDLFHDDEGHSENVCTTNDNGDEECHDEWVEAPPAPEVEGALILSIPAVSGTVNYAAAEDLFQLSDMSLGDLSTSIMIDIESILALDINPEDGRAMNLELGGELDQDVVFQISPKLDLQATIGEWTKLSSVIEQMPSLSHGETLGVRFDGSDAPTLKILLSEEDDTEIQISSGKLTLWSSAMTEDVVIEEGMCMEGVDDDSMTEEEKDAQHDLFGGMKGGTCGP